MAKLPKETTVTINSLKQQSLEIVERATAAEFTLFQFFGETEQTITFLSDLKTVAEDARTSFSRLSNLQLRTAEAQPVASTDTLKLLDQLIARTQARIPTWERSIEEVKIEWNLL